MIYAIISPVSNVFKAIFNISYICRFYIPLFVIKR